VNRFFLVGLSHKTAPVEWREKLAIPEARVVPFLKSVIGSAVSEVVVLSTCNRVELYAVGREDAPPYLRQALTTLEGNVPLPEGDIRPSAFYSYSDGEAVGHLFRVAAGLDSLVVGESEILGQMKRAYETARLAGTTGKLTNVIFQRALYLGKLIRTSTALTEGPTSVAGLAVTLAGRIFGNLEESRVLIVGAGKMAELSARYFLSQKISTLTVINRTFEKAEELARRFEGRAAPFERLPHELTCADIVISSAGSSEPILSSPTVARVMKERRNRSLFLIDIAVPRSIDAAVHRLDNVYLYNIDDLESLVAQSLVSRRSEIEKAEALVDEKRREFHLWYKAWQEGQSIALQHQ
jgi:glutamyl-tRNA reductase